MIHLITTMMTIEEQPHHRLFGETAVPSALFCTAFPPQLFISESGAEKLTFLYIDAYDNISIYLPLRRHQESMGSQLLVDLFRNSTAQAFPQRWKVPEELPRCFPVHTKLFFPVGIVILCRCTLSATIVSSLLFVVITFKLRTWTICLFRLATIRNENARSLSASNAGFEFFLLWTSRFPIESRPLDTWLVVRRHPCGTPLINSPVYVCI